MNEVITPNEFLKNESIVNREEISAPKNYISVYHETSEKNIKNIDNFGLNSDKNRQGYYTTNEKIEKLNKILEEVKLEKYQRLGISRDKTIFAYPFKESGHGLGGLADIKFNEKKLKDDFETLKDYQKDWLENKGIDDFEDYYKYLINETQKKGKSVILEMKVDPKKCFIGDLDYIEEARYNDLDIEEKRNKLKKFWDNLVNMEDIIKYYKKSEKDNDFELEDSNCFKGFAKIKGAPKHLPNNIIWPEILINGVIEQKYIKVLK